MYVCIYSLRIKPYVIIISVENYVDNQVEFTTVSVIFAIIYR